MGIEDKDTVKNINNDFDENFYNGSKERYEYDIMN